MFLINLIVQDGVTHIRKYLENIRKALLFIQCSTSRYKKIRKLCSKNNIRPKFFKMDVQHRRNSTYDMLNSCISYSEIITLFCNEKNIDPNSFLSENDWSNCKIIDDYLEPLYETTKSLSGQYYPTSALVLSHMYQLSCFFKL